MIFKFLSKKFYTFVVALLLSAAGSAQQQTPYVILVSFDGFRHDYVEKLDLPNFKAFIKTGTKAEAIIPCYPSLTFPNHYSIVTGMYPGHHGLVDNYFFDQVSNTTYQMSNRQRVEDPQYYGGTPIWQLAKQNGLKSASYFWVGSELTDPNKRPDYFFRYDESVPFQDRIDQVLAWLKLPEQERPHLITLYFSIPDHQSHDFGPWGEETKRVLMKADSLLGNLMRGLQEIKLPINTILVSDHGLSELTTDPETFIFLNELINVNDSSIRISHSRALTHLYIKDAAKRDSLYNLLKQKENNFTVYRKKDTPDRWHYKSARVGDLLIVAKPYHSIQRNDRATFLKRAKMGTKFGVHGYDPAIVTDVHGIFYASGPNIKSGLSIKAFPNIDVYPLIARILDLPLPPIDGNPKTLQKVYKK